MFKLGNYNLVERLKAVSFLSADALETFNEKYPNKKDIKYIGMVCEVDKNSLPLHLKFLYNKINATDEKSDGMVSTNSQIWGECQKYYKLDHHSQIGYNFYINPIKRKSINTEYKRLIKDIAEVCNN